MSCESLSQLANQELLDALDGLEATDRTNNAALLRHLAEVDARRLYVPAGCSTMFAYCVERRGYSEDVAFARIRVARAARRFPRILDALEEGRLHLTAVVRLAPYLRQWNADELLSAAEHKTKMQVLELIAERFPRADVPTRVHAVAQAAVVAPACHEVAALAATEVAPAIGGDHGEPMGPLGPDPVAPSPSATVEPAFPVVEMTPLARTTPRSPDRYALQFTVSRETHDRLRRVQDLLASAVTCADIPDVFERALKLLEAALEKQRYSATESPRAPRGSSDPRHVPAAVQREVWERDGGRCTYESDDGHRCTARRWLECDHIVPVARGGESTTANLRLRCKAHNQLAAEQLFGAGFMRAKRSASLSASPSPRTSGRA